MPRRRFFGGLAVFGLGLTTKFRLAGEMPLGSAPGKGPLVITSTGNRFVREAVTTEAWKEILSGGSALDAAIKGANVSELDPRDPSVGYGGDPNEEGFLQLDASVMDGLTGGAGAVAALENIKTPSIVARLVMERTDHLMLVGKGALKFAKMHGLKEEDLLTDNARDHWREWKENLSQRDYYRPPANPDKPEGGGTINVLVLDGKGNLAGVTSTVGHHFKIVGRVGDSPIIGAGLYVDNEVGAAGATGHGEEAIKACASFHVVEKMREGMSPRDACVFVCRRVAGKHKGNPQFNLKLVAIGKSGDYGCCALRGKKDLSSSKITGLGFCIHDAGGHRREDGDALLPPMTEEEIKAVPWR